MLLLELTHTSHTAAATGIQQVCRNLFTELGEITPVDALLHDPWQRSWRLTNASERERLAPCDNDGAARRKGEAWTTGEKLRGRLRMLSGCKGSLPADVYAVLFPEFIMGRCIWALPDLRKRLGREVPFLAVFHDAIALKMPELSARKTVERIPEYLVALAGFDAVAAVSEASRQELFGLWAGMGIRDVPPVEVIHLGINKPERVEGDHKASERPRALCVATLEPRKNHLALLDAAELLWAEGLDFELELIGMAHRELGAAIVDKIHALEAKRRPIKWLGPVDGATLRARYAACDFTAYCSLMEGFGLPVMESMAYGKPCLCTTCGALDEVSVGGGCLRLAGTDATCISEGLRQMITDAALRERLRTEAEARPLRTWADYALDVQAWALAAKKMR